MFSFDTKIKNLDSYSPGKSRDKVDLNETIPLKNQDISVIFDANASVAPKKIQSIFLGGDGKEANNEPVDV
jgi:hypothetical protein